jgi:DNA-directed RNA polymerase specialized sigma24 family protein
MTPLSSAERITYMDSQAGTITHAIVNLKEGHSSALQSLWVRYHAQLVRRARRQLQAKRVDLAVSDEEDIAASAFQTFYDGVKQGRFPQLNDRDDLWRILVHIAACKIADKRRYDTSARRDTRRTQSLHVPTGQSDDESLLLEPIVGKEPGPELIATVTEEYLRLLHALDDDRLRRIVGLKLACYTTQEIARALNCSKRTVDFKLELIRRRWQQETTHEFHEPSE